MHLGTVNVLPVGLVTSPSQMANFMKLMDYLIAKNITMKVSMARSEKSKIKLL